MTDWDARRVLFICDFGPPFSGSDFRGRGVGGTEASVVLLAEAWAARGASVVVANRVTAPREDRGVRYIPLAHLTQEPADIVVLWKLWSDAAADRDGRRAFVWTDVHMPDVPMLQRCRDWADVTMVLSAFQRDVLDRATRGRAPVAIGAPINLDDYPQAPSPKERTLLYCSVPDRGLYYLKDLFPKIRRRVPDARLAITSDFTLWSGEAAKDSFAQLFAGQEGIEYVGHVSRAELVEWQRRARVMAYPCRFPEGFCLAAAECMAAGAVPITTRDYALVTTVADAGVLVKGHPRGWLYRRRFVRACVELLTNDRVWVEMAARGRTRATAYAAPNVLDLIVSALA